MPKIQTMHSTPTMMPTQMVGSLTGRYAAVENESSTQPNPTVESRAER